MTESQGQQLILYRLDDLKNDVNELLRRQDERDKKCEQHEVRLCAHDKDICEINRTVHPLREKLLSMGLAALGGGTIAGMMIYILIRGH